MKTMTAIVVAVAMGLSVNAANKSKDATASVEIDKSLSKVHWTGKKVSGEHTGYLSLKDGQLFMTGNEITGGSFDMDLNSIVCTDLKNEQWNKKLVNHLKSDDFFSVENHPVAKFEITSVEGKSEGEIHVKGDLTIKGITHEIAFPAKVSIEGGLVQASGSATIDRTKYDIRYGSGKFFQGLGDSMINDEFVIAFEVSAKSGEEVTLR